MAHSHLHHQQKLSADVPALNHLQASSSRLEMMSALNIYHDAGSVRKSGIVCTIGPSTRDTAMLLKLMQTGLCVVRLNFSHGSHEYHAETIANAREAANQFGRPIAIALDTKGPEIRTGLLEGSDKDPRLVIELEKGAKITITTNDDFKEKCTAQKLYADYKNLPKVMKVGGLIYIDDGLISVKVDKISGTDLECTVVNSGALGSRKGVNLPEVKVDLPAVSKKDEGDLVFGVEQDVDMVFASFIRKRSDVKEVRKALGEKGKRILIISKIENHEGMQNFDEILEESDGIMVARGDLGIEIPAEKVFIAQKMMIAKCNRAGKPVITATQMLESMVKAPRPTRAEGSDVANAVLDGTDCVMLSGETAKGDYPIEAVDIMARICREAESAMHYTQFREELRRELLLKKPTTTESVCLAAVDAASFNMAKAIVVLTISGSTARYLAKWRPNCPIIVITRHGHVARQLHLHRAIFPLHYEEERAMEHPWAADVDKRVFWALEKAKAAGLVKSGDETVVVHGWHTGSGHTNTLRVLTTP